MGGGLALRDVDARAKEPPELTIVRAFLRPVDLPALGIHRDPDAPFGRITTIGVAVSRLDERLDGRAVVVRAHDAHAFAIRPVQLAGRLLEVQLLGSEGRALGNDDLAIGAVWIQREHASAAEIEEEQATGGGFAAGTALRLGDLGSTHVSLP